MKDAWDKFKISSDALKANWPMILICLTALSSGATNLGQYFTNQDLEIEQIASHEQIANIAKHYAAPKTITVKSTCSSCGSYLNAHISEYH